MILYQFGAEWCNPCKVLRETLTTNRVYGAKYVFIDCDDDANDELVEKHNIDFMPTLILMDGDTVLERWVGIPDRYEIQKAIYAHGGKQEIEL
jgi:thioredoxin-like negative regulator of GroEL